MSDQRLACPPQVNEESLFADPETTYALWDAGVTAQGVGDLDTARVCLAAAVRVAERHSLPPNVLGKIRISLGRVLTDALDYDAANAVLQQVHGDELRLSPATGHSLRDALEALRTRRSQHNGAGAGAVKSETLSPVSGAEPEHQFPVIGPIPQSETVSPVSNHTASPARKLARREPWGRVAIALSLFLSFVIGFIASPPTGGDKVERARTLAELSEERARKAEVTAERDQERDHRKRLALENQDLRAATDTLDAATSGASGPIRTISFVNATPLAPAAPEGKVKLTIRNGFLPCRLVWQCGEEKGEIEVAQGDTSATLPSGRLKIVCEPKFKAAWFQPFGIVQGGEYLGSTLGPTLLTVEPGETLVIQMDQPFAPWNAVVLPVKGEWVAVTLMRPWAGLDVEAYQAGKWKGDELLPNTALFWANEGSKGLAAELASTFVTQRGEPEKGGHFRGKMHTSMIVCTAQGKVPAALQDITEKELTSDLHAAFELLRKQSPPVGPTIQQEIDQAGKLLKTLKSDKDK